MRASNASQRCNLSNASQQRKLSERRCPPPSPSPWAVAGLCISNPTLTQAEQQELSNTSTTAPPTLPLAASAQRKTRRQQLAPFVAAPPPPLPLHRHCPSTNAHGCTAINALTLPPPPRRSPPLHAAIFYVNGAGGKLFSKAWGRLVAFFSFFLVGNAFYKMRNFLGTESLLDVGTKGNNNNIYPYDRRYATTSITT